ncbi:MAG: glycosyltransferase family 2 protein [Sedimentisphaerales bacterium]|nr:glycosyltransferase family 2 protein [Sedimentisphaerales bacterium]
MEQNNIDLSVVIVSHGHEGLLGDCVGSLLGGLEGLKAEILVLDNLGGQAVEAVVSGIDARVNCFGNAEPQSLSQNVNEMAAKSRGKFLLMLNPDTVYQSGALKDALAYLESDTKTGILGCRLLNMDGTVQPSCRQFPTLPVVMLRGFGVDRWPWRPRFYRKRVMDTLDYDKQQLVDWIFGAFILVRREEYLRLGGMDQGYRLYYEDVDLCYRYRKAGLRTGYFPGVSFMHKHMRTSAKVPFGRHWRWHVSSVMRYFREQGYWFRPGFSSDKFSLTGLQDCHD